MMESLKVFVRPTGLHSRAMIRVADALSEFTVPGIDVVSRPEWADLQVLHVIDSLEGANLPENHVIIQYCLDTTRMPAASWCPYWEKANLVWSYYNLRARAGYEGDNFYYAPLGVDEVFFRQPWAKERSLIVTTGYVGGYPAEAIGEVWDAAEAAGLPGIHVGPNRVENVGRSLPAGWKAVSGIDDETLAGYYARARFVSGLRYLEGFELPAAEGIACGARALLFDQPTTRNWYGPRASYFQERDPVRLVEELTDLFKQPYVVADANSFDHTDFKADFNWRPIVANFWRAVLRQTAANRQKQITEVAQ